MQKLHRDILVRLRENIVNEIDVHNHIIENLRRPVILTDNHIKLISRGTTNKERAELLLDILPERGPHAFSYFYQSLRLQYGWICDSIDKLVEEAGSYSSEARSTHSNIPSISPLTVDRKEEEKELKNALKTLLPKGYVVLHGMKGNGKSCLARNVLHDLELVSKLFDNQIYWVEFGKHRPVKEDIWIQMKNLYHQITKSPYIAEANTSNHVQLRLIIQNHFRQTAHKNALLILDDVQKQEVIDNFDFDCKILVTTTDISVLQNKHARNVEMKDGFTKSETLQLFAQVLNMEVEKLPKEAALIHDECKGKPVLITMLATQFNNFKHAMQYGNERWKYYLKSLKTKQNNVIQKQQAIIKMSLDQLNEELKNKYKMLAIFNEDVNIMPKTLEILWDEENSCHVEEIMLEFFSKSLAVRQWNLDVKSYVYGIHGHIIEYLRNAIPSEELVQMHWFFVEKYRKYGDGTLIKLPDDNYSYTYIGHHLEQAKLFEEFPDLYLNFDFLQAKVYHAGVSDLLIDLDLYRPYITKGDDPDLESKVKDLELFLKEHTSMLARQRSREYLDLVQIAMNHPVDGFIRRTARRLAEKRTSSLYLSLESKVNHAEAPVSEEVPVNATVARFTDNPNEILLGGDYGQILLWNSVSRVSKYFYGHSRNSVIQKILISKDGNHFLSLSSDGVVKLFELEGQDYLNPKSPRQRQSNWYSQFNEEDDSKISISVNEDIITDVSFGRTDDTIVTCTYKGLIEIWLRNGSKIFKEQSLHSKSIRKILLTNDYRLLHCLNLKEGILEVYGYSSNSYSHLSQFNLQKKNMQVVYIVEYNKTHRSGSMLIVTQNKVLLVQWYYSDGQIHSYDVKLWHTIDGDRQRGNAVFTCAALTYDEKCLILADSGGNITVIDVFIMGEDNTIISYKAHASSLDTYLLNERSHMICGSENRIILMWKLDVNNDSARVTKPSVCAVMKAADKEDIIVTETILGSIVVLSNERMLYEIPKVDGKIAKLFLIEEDRIVLLTEEKKMVKIIDCRTQLVRDIFPVADTDNLLTVIAFDKRSAIICQENTLDIKVWYEESKNGDIKQGVNTVIKNVGSIFELFQLAPNVLLTITHDGKIKFWNVRGTNWKEMKSYNCDIGQSKVTYSCLSSDKECLAIVCDFNKVLLHFIDADQTEGALSDLPEEQLRQTEVFLDNSDSEKPEKVKCCSFSWDRRYLAVGMDSGRISIIDLTSGSEIKKLNYHKHAVEQLHWVPASIGMPIFMSISNTQMVWWNLSLSKFKRTVQRQSRMGNMSSSNSSPNVSLSPRSSLVMSNSKSVDFSRLSLSLSDSQSNGSTSTESTPNSTEPTKLFWQGKTGRDSRHPELLGVVPLPTICTTQAIVSEDFVKFLTVDMHGSITKYKLFQK